MLYKDLHNCLRFKLRSKYNNREIIYKNHIQSRLLIDQ